MSLLTEEMSDSKPREDGKQTKADEIMPHLPACKYNDGVACDTKCRKCARCGWNPTVAELRKMAIRMGDKHFLRFTDRDLVHQDARVYSL